MNPTLPPHSIEAEEALLGSILIEPEQLHRVAPIIGAQDFYLVKNKWVFDAIANLDKTNSQIDFVTVCNELSRAGHLDEIGGPAYISHLVGVVPTSLHAVGYSEVVGNAARRRALISAASDIAKLAYSEDKSICDIETLALDCVMRNQRESATAQSAHDVSTALFAKVEHYCTNPPLDGVRGLATGIRGLDKAIGGFDPGLIILAARPSVGKSALAGQIAENVAMSGKRVLFHSLEMTNEQVVRRMACGRARVNWLHVKQGNVKEEDLERLMREIGELGTLPIILDDSTSINISQLRSSVARNSAVSKLDLVVLDHLGLMSDTARDEVARLNNISRGCKAIAKDYHVPVLAIHQLNRAVEGRDDKRPTMTDLRDSGHLEQNADIVLMLYRAKYYSPDIDDNTAEVIARKNRDGEMHAVAKMVFLDEFVRFMPYAY